MECGDRRQVREARHRAIVVDHDVRGAALLPSLVAEAPEVGGVLRLPARPLPRGHLLRPVTLGGVNDDLSNPVLRSLSTIGRIQLAPTDIADSDDREPWNQDAITANEQTI